MLYVISYRADNKQINKGGDCEVGTKIQFSLWLGSECRYNWFLMAGKTMIPCRPTTRAVSFCGAIKRCTNARDMVWFYVQ